ncbi:MAG TPA: hypothetical protein DCY84_01920 [Firmicutes bacterium]|nr:hypothetical protein [Bacillota bacterium]
MKCVNCPIKHIGVTPGRVLVCAIEESVLDLTNLLLVSPKDIETVKCQQNLDAVIRECQARINDLHGVIERAMNLKTEREGTK